MGSLRRSCATVREPLELRFWVVREVGRGIGGDAACSQITLGNFLVYCYTLRFATHFPVFYLVLLIV